MNNTEKQYIVDSTLFDNTEYKIKNNCLYKEIYKKDNVTTKKYFSC